MLLSLSKGAQNSATKATARPPRYWRVPPALLRNPSSPETFEGESILAEYPNEAGLLLWQSYRDVLLWAMTPPELRAELFHRPDSEQRREAARGLDPAMVRAVRTLRQALRGSRINGSVVSAALSISAAAERVRATATAMAYAQLASAAVPSMAGPALTAGELAARLGHPAVAETWLRRTIALARRSGDWACYGGALTAVARLRERAGRVRGARTEYRKALRLARRRGLHETKCRALGGLLRIALQEEDQPAAERYAAYALRVLGQDHPERGIVLLDVAKMELRRSQFAQAATRLNEALRSQIGTDGQVRAWTMLVRAAGGVGDETGVEAAWHRALDLIDTFGSTSAAARLLLGLARAGGEVLAETQADAVARRARSYAARLGDSSLADECSAFLSRARLPPVVGG
jgi:tetratricopeptide (TPR) repeat protein